MERVDRPVSPADYDPERHYDEQGVDPNPALDDKPAKGSRTGERALEPTTAYGFGAATMTEPRAAAIDGIEESPTWAGQDTDRPSNLTEDGVERPSGQDEATRGYAAVDQHIFELLGAHMTQHGQLDPTKITVYVAQGIVTLTGTVEAHAGKQALEELARGIEGVQDVRNMLYVADGGDQPGTLPAAGSPVPADAQYSGHSERLSAQPPARTGEGAISDMSRAIPETTPVTAFTDAAGRTTDLGVAEGMEVFGADGTLVGQIKEVRVSDFLVSRTLARDVYAPFEYVQFIDGNQVTLMVDADDVGDQGWANP